LPRVTFYKYAGYNKFNVNNYRLKIVLSNGLLFVFGALLQNSKHRHGFEDVYMSIPVIRYCFPFMLIVVYRQASRFLVGKDFQNIWRILGTIGGKFMIRSPRSGSFIDLFSGCGGLSLGLMKAGWRGVFAIEQSPDAFKTLKHNLIERNHHNPEKLFFDWPDWLEVKPFEISKFVQEYSHKLKSLRREIHLVAGGPPCQGFSLAGRRTVNDPRNELFRYHLQVVDLVKPHFVLMENVQGIAIPFKNSERAGSNFHGNKRKSYARLIYSMLEEHGYVVQQHVLKAADFGVPQLRPRFFTFGFRRDLIKNNQVPDMHDLLFELRDNFLRTRGLPINRPVTVKEAISDLAVAGKRIVECRDKESPAGFMEIAYVGPETAYQRLMNKDMSGCQLNSLRLVNHREKTVQKFREILATTRKGVQLSSKDRARLGIRKSSITPLDPNEPSHTLTTLPDDLLHYSDPRVHTVREHARLQSFPDWFEFLGKYTTGGKRRAYECPRYTQVGNAVPPLLAEIIGEALLIMLNEYGR
jgi:DNA (cytosine-5)-methyltransferase 1